MVKQATERGLAGLEHLAGIPGSVGGMVRMNAGGRSGDIGSVTRAVRVLRRSGEIVTLAPAEVGFAYRHTNLAGDIVLGATFSLRADDADEVRRRTLEFWTTKHASQPAMSKRSSGCVFKNPPGLFAGKLLDEAGLKGTRVGGAEISAKHANFIVAGADAHAQDVLDLIELARRRVREKAGVELELEVEIW